MIWNLKSSHIYQKVAESCSEVNFQLNTKSENNDNNHHVGGLITMQ